MARNSRQRRAAKARAAAAANNTSYQQELEKLRGAGGGAPPGTGGVPTSSPGDDGPDPGNWPVPEVEEGVLLEELRLSIPDGLPRMGAAYIAEVVDDFGTGRDQVQAYDDDTDFGQFEDFGITVVRLGGWMPGRKARALVKAGEASLTAGDDGVDTGDGVPVEFAHHYTIHSTQQIVVTGNEEEGQGWEHSWEHDLAMDDPHPWKEGSTR